MHYSTPYDIGLGDLVLFKGIIYYVLINYIKGETDAKGYTPNSNRTILINDTYGTRIMCHNYKELEVIDYE
jgi:hypothetical protein